MPLSLLSALVLTYIHTCAVTTHAFQWSSPGFLYSSPVQQIVMACCKSVATCPTAALGGNVGWFCPVTGGGSHCSHSCCFLANADVGAVHGWLGPATTIATTERLCSWLLLHWALVESPIGWYCTVAEQLDKTNCCVVVRRGSSWYCTPPSPLSTEGNWLSPAAVVSIYIGCLVHDFSRWYYRHT